MASTATHTFIPSAAWEFLESRDVVWGDRDGVQMASDLEMVMNKLTPAEQHFVYGPCLYSYLIERLPKVTNEYKLEAELADLKSYENAPPPIKAIHDEIGLTSKPEVIMWTKKFRNDLRTRTAFVDDDHIGLCAFQDDKEKAKALKIKLLQPSKGTYITLALCPRRVFHRLYIAVLQKFAVPLLEHNHLTIAQGEEGGIKFQLHLKEEYFHSNLVGIYLPGKGNFLRNFLKSAVQERIGNRDVNTSNGAPNPGPSTTSPSEAPAITSAAVAVVHSPTAGDTIASIPATTITPSTVTASAKTGRRTYQMPDEATMQNQAKLQSILAKLLSNQSVENAVLLNAQKGVNVLGESLLASQKSVATSQESVAASQQVLLNAQTSFTDLRLHMKAREEYSRKIYQQLLHINTTELFGSPGGSTRVSPKKDGSPVNIPPAAIFPSSNGRFTQQSSGQSSGGRFGLDPDGNPISSIKRGQFDFNDSDDDQGQDG